VAFLRLGALRALLPLLVPPSVRHGYTRTAMNKAIAVALRMAENSGSWRCVLRAVCLRLSLVVCPVRCAVASEVVDTLTHSCLNSLMCCAVGCTYHHHHRHQTYFPLFCLPVPSLRSLSTQRLCVRRCATSCCPRAPSVPLPCPCFSHGVTLADLPPPTAVTTVEAPTQLQVQA